MNSGLLAIIGLVFCYFLLSSLAPVLMPFVVAAVLAYIGDPLADRLEAKGLSRTGAVVVVFCGLSFVGLTAFVIALPALIEQSQLLLQRLLQLTLWIQQTLWPNMRVSLGLADETPSIETARKALSGHWGSAGAVLGFLWEKLSGSSLLFFTWLANLTLIPVVAFYLLRDWDILVARIHHLLPRRYEPKIALIARECDSVLGAFARGQLLVMLALAVVYTVGLALVGLDMALVLGMLAGLASVVPYLGFIVGIIASEAAAFFQFDSVWPMVAVAVVFGIGQLLEGMWLTPVLVGEKIGLHPVAVIFAVLAGGQLFGFLGILLALPIAAVIKVMLDHAGEFYLTSVWYGPQSYLENGEIEAEVACDDETNKESGQQSEPEADK
ncbi:AI-2E family transporter [Spongiibacter sp. KMU-158]|uniref:AI-2E family transporter n=1 Tax=Spongiibacter pelagi TaxID=2760804 RepID=A0A927GVY9_9GAMM|nr:AI-2E family transporter [Spongiibacter pelagi]